MLGPHVIRPTPKALQWARTAGIVKGLDNLDVFYAAPPGAFRVFRHYFAHQNLDDGVGAANEIIKALQGYHHQHLFVEVWNEEKPTWQQLRKAVHVLHTAGYKVAGGSYGTGDYDATDFEIVRKSWADSIAIHCYWDPYHIDKWEAYRYRMYPTHLPILITECGRRHGHHDADELRAYDRGISEDPEVIGATPFTGGPTPDWEDFNTDDLNLGGQA